jgi:uncharacterized integral membrane protein
MMKMMSRWHPYCCTTHNWYDNSSLDMHAISTCKCRYQCFSPKMLTLIPTAFNSSIIIQLTVGSWDVHIWQQFSFHYCYNWIYGMFAASFPFSFSEKNVAMIVVNWSKSYQQVLQKDFG